MIHRLWRWLTGRPQVHFKEWLPDNPFEWQEPVKAESGFTDFKADAIYHRSRVTVAGTMNADTSEGDVVVGGWTKIDGIKPLMDEPGVKVAIGTRKHPLQMVQEAMSEVPMDACQVFYRLTDIQNTLDELSSRLSRIEAKLLGQFHGGAIGGGPAPMQGSQ